MIVKVKTLFFDWIFIEQTENIFFLLNNLIPTEHKKFFSENMHTFKENFSFFLSNHPFHFLLVSNIYIFNMYICKKNA